jgi:glycosyltransferase involved in cell wall biosynthesis
VASVSIIIPCYNGAAYREEALLSALAQSYSEVEILVVDDGSTDASPEIAQRFAVRYIRQQNRGKSETRNLGIQKCKRRLRSLFGCG